MNNGTQFNGNSFRNLLKIHKIKEFFIPPYSPQSNGISERLNEKILNAIRTFEGKNFVKIEKIIWQSLNCTPNQTTGFTPCEIILGSDIIAQKPIFNLNNSIEASKRKSKYESKKIMNKNYRQKNVAKAKRLYLKAKRLNKFDPFRVGPYDIIEFKNDNRTIKILKDKNKYIVSFRNVLFDFEEVKQDVGL
ncbi:hypothetical protein DMUE_5501 [Dictyocoela muelleri]|nr:hypothetical protein DMUE_5501 [Dictyocoela muelleri]